MKRWSQSSRALRKTISSRNGRAIPEQKTTAIFGTVPRCMLSSRPLSPGAPSNSEPTTAELIALRRSVSGAHQSKCHKECALVLNPKSERVHFIRWRIPNHKVPSPPTAPKTATPKAIHEPDLTISPRNSPPTKAPAPMPNMLSTAQRRCGSLTVGGSECALSLRVCLFSTVRHCTR